MGFDLAWEVRRFTSPRRGPSTGLDHCSLASLRYPDDDGCPEMDLDLIDQPSAPVARRDPGQPIPMPPMAPMIGKLSEFGKLLVGSQLRKRK
jgi:hypothetical protein